MEIKETGIPIKYRLYMRIFVATFLGWAVPLIVYRLVQPKMITFTFTVNEVGVASILTIGLMLLAIGGNFTGFWISLAQWIALREYISSVWKWIGCQVFIWIMGGIIVFVIITMQSLAVPYSQYDTVFTKWTLIQIISAGLFTGICVGILQQVFLQKRTGIRFWWAVAGLFGVFSGTFLEGANRAASYYYVTIDPIYSAILSGLVFAGIAGLPALLFRPLEKSSSRAPTEREGISESPLIPSQP